MACKYFQFDSTEQCHIQFISDIVWQKGPCKYQCLSITSFWYSTLVVSVTAWWRHQMETLSALLAICTGNSPVTGEFPAQRPMTLSFYVFFDLPWINRWANNRESGDLIHHRAHYGVAIMEPLNNWIIFSSKCVRGLFTSNVTIHSEACLTKNSWSVYSRFDWWCPHVLMPGYQRPQ